MNVYAYFDASVARPDQGQIIRLWHDSWKRNGWTPRLLHPRNAQRHSWWERAFAWDDSIARPFTARWFALDAVESHSALLVDYDVINFGLTPRRVCGPMSLYGSGVVGSARLARRRFLRALGSAAGRFPCNVSREAWSLSYQFPGWEAAPLVHFRRLSVVGPKHRAILDCGRKIY